MPDQQDWQSDGLANILISRIQPNGKFLFGMYLVDVLCTGIEKHVRQCRPPAGTL